ncbi:hypothetical protein ACEN19_07940 [Corynebacterium auriscanis]|uniref:hypothetical protein n=1 Tax=Corynebacterium auriscanis TaxID=99807 RepID=UPI003CFB1B97
MNTVEGAIVLSAMTLVAAGAVSGFVTLAEHSAAQALARDAARAGALGQDAQAYVVQRDPEARVHVSHDRVGELRVVRVTVSKDAPLMDVSAGAVVVAEPTE